MYLATVIDCHTKEVIGWAMDDNYQTPLISLAIDRAAKNYRLVPDAIFHSDRGSNYTSSEFERTLARHHLRRSVGRTGICYDNAMAESFFAALKNELVHRTVYPTRKHAYLDIARYIELGIILGVAIQGWGTALHTTPTASTLTAKLQRRTHQTAVWFSRGSSTTALRIVRQTVSQQGSFPPQHP